MTAPFIQHCNPLSGHSLAEAMNARLSDPGLARQLVQLLETCEAGMFTNAVLGDSRELLLQQTKEVFEKADAGLL